MYYKRIYIECLTTSIMSPALAALGDWSSGRRMRSGAPITLPLPVDNNDNNVLKKIINKNTQKVCIPIP